MNGQLSINTILQGDCISGMAAIPDGSVDLVFADPPFNIGYDYDVYDDVLEHENYIEWSREWISGVYNVLSEHGAFWLAIGDEYAAELKLASQQIGFHCRSWVIWYYTFGVNCSNKFSRSHAHLFHFVKSANDFTFNNGDGQSFVRVPSARQLVYNDKRANSKGRLPDDTWIIRPGDAVGELTDVENSWSPDDLVPPADNEQTYTLRPQDLDECFKADEDTWYFPRVAGTFKERAGFHGCQMPEQLLARILRTCSNEGDFVLDPFSGSATTLVVAKKLGRRYFGFDISDDYVKHGLGRLESVRVGDPPDGSAEPLVSAPKTNGSRKKPSGKQKKQTRPNDSHQARGKDRRYAEIQLDLTLRGVTEAFQLAHDGFSADRVVTDPDLNGQFVDTCGKLGLVGDARTWNILLFRLRKAGRLAHIETTQRTSISWEDCDNYIFASEIALQSMLTDKKAESLDEILCDPFLVAEFDKCARRFASGFSSLEYRWAALKLRKQAKVARSRGSVLSPPSRLGKMTAIEELNVSNLPDGPGVYLISKSPSERLYAGETLNLKARLTKQFGKKKSRDEWSKLSDSISIQSFRTNTVPAEMLAWESCLVKKYKPLLNFHELRTAT